MKAEKIAERVIGGRGVKRDLNSGRWVIKRDDGAQSRHRPQIPALTSSRNLYNIISGDTRCSNLLAPFFLVHAVIFELTADVAALWSRGDRKRPWEMQSANQMRGNDTTPRVPSLPHFSATDIRRMEKRSASGNKSLPILIRALPSPHRGTIH